MATPGLIYRVGAVVDPSLQATLKASTTMAVAENRKAMAVIAADIKAQQAIIIGLSRNKSTTEANAEQIVGRERYVAQQQLKLQLLASTSAALIAGISSKQVAAAQAEAKAIADAAALEVISKKAAATAMWDISVMENMKEFEAKKAAAAMQLETDRETTAQIIGLQEWQAIETARIAKASALATIEARISAAGGGMMGGHGFAAYGGPGGGISGIMRETLVIFRELGRGNFTRMPGSVVLLAQYMGLLGVVIKSTAKESVKAFFAEVKLGKAMDVAALSAMAKAEASMAAAAAEDYNSAALNAEAEADERNAAAAVAAAEGQNIKAEASKKSMMAALATAKNSIGPWGLVAAAVIAVGAAAYFTWRHFRTLAIEAKNLADAMNPLKKLLSETADEQLRLAEAAQKEADYLRDLNDAHKTESELLDRKIKLLDMEAEARRKTMEARGAGAAALQAFDIAELNRKKDLLMTEQKRLELEVITSQEDQAMAAKQAAYGAHIGGVNMAGAKNVFDKAKEIADAAQAAAEGRGGGELESHRAKVKELQDFIAAGKEKPAYEYPGVTPSQALKMEQDAIDSLENQPVNVKVGNKDYGSMTVAQAKANLAAATSLMEKLAVLQKKYNDIEKDTTKTADEKHAALVKVQGDIQAVNDALGIKATDPILDKSRGGQSDIFGLTDRQRAGAQIEGPAMALLDVNKQQLVVLHRIDKNTAGGGNKSPWGGQR